jgi:hypothetical protein
MFLARSTIKAVQAQYARNGRLAMMHVDHVLGICGEIIHVCSAQETNSGDQNQCKGVCEHRQLFSTMPAPRTLKRTQFSARSDQYGY